MAMGNSWPFPLLAPSHHQLVSIPCCIKPHCASPHAMPHLISIKQGFEYHTWCGHFSYFPLPSPSITHPTKLSLQHVCHATPPITPHQTLNDQSSEYPSWCTQTLVYI